MDSDDLLNALGALTLNFAALDEMVSFHTAWLLGTEDWQDREPAMAKCPFGKKLARMRQLLQQYGARHGMANHKTVIDLGAFCDGAEALAHDRNGVVHSYVREFFLHLPTGEKRPKDPEYVQTLAKRAATLALDCGFLMKALDEATPGHESGE